MTASGVGAGCKSKPMAPERMLPVIVHLRQGFTLEFPSLSLEMDKSNGDPSLDLTLPVLERALPGPVRARTLQSLPGEPPKSNGGRVDNGDGTGRDGALVPRRREIRTLKEFLERSRNSRISEG